LFEANVRPFEKSSGLPSTSVIIPPASSISKLPVA
jgi:hypothetical protein